MARRRTAGHVAVVALALGGLAVCACEGTPDRSVTSTGLEAAQMAPWVVVDSDGTNVSVYVAFRTGDPPNVRPVAMGSGDTLSVLVGQNIVYFRSFSTYSGTAFRGLPMLREHTAGLDSMVVYVARAQLSAPGPVDVVVDLARGEQRGGSLTVARVRLAGPVQLTTPPEPVVKVGGATKPCWTTARSDDGAGEMTTELGTFGECLFGTTVYSTDPAVLPSGCGTIDFDKASMNDPSGCPVTTFVRQRTRGEYVAPFRVALDPTLAPFDEAPRAFSYRIAESRLVR